MPYSITLRSRIDASITGWYDGSKWSTDHKRRRLFDHKHEAKSMREDGRYAQKGRQRRAFECGGKQVPRRHVFSSARGRS